MAQQKSLRQIAPVLEFACWLIVAIVPFLRLVNGPAVTHDQFIIQVTLFTLALAGAIGLRLVKALGAGS